MTLLLRGIGYVRLASCTVIVPPHWGIGVLMHGAIVPRDLPLPTFASRSEHHFMQGLKSRLTQ